MATLGRNSMKTSRQRAPHVNLFDVPETMPGAQPSANSAQREEFEHRCRQLYQEQVHEERIGSSPNAIGTGRADLVEDLQAMFPAIDAAIVQMLCAETSTSQQALDTLLAISSDITEPVPGGGEPTPSQPQNLAVDDHEKFPSLASADGWQIPNQRGFDREDEELGSIWRDRVKASADIQAPPVPTRAHQVAWGAVPRQRRSQTKKVDAKDGELLETDYEFRHRVGQRRVNDRALFGRGGARGRGEGGYAGGNHAAARDGDDTSEQEGPGQPEGEVDRSSMAVNMIESPPTL